MKLSLTIFLAALLALLAGQGCSDDPNDVGISMVAPSDTLRLSSAVLAGTFDTTYLARISGTSSFLIGRTAGLQAWTLMQFTGFASIPPNAIIDSAVVMVPRNYSFLDSSGILGFAVHEMQRPWSQSTFEWDSLAIAGAFTSAADTTALLRIGASDTAFSFRIDGLVSRWVKDTTDVPNGILLIPDSVSTTIVAGSRSISGIETRPLLTVSWRDSVDTVHTYSVRTSQGTFVANGTALSSPSLFVVQAGIGYRGVVRFDSLALPRNASITQATLELAVRNDSSLLNGFTRDSLVAYLLRVRTFPYDSLVLATVCSPGFDGSQKVYRGDLRTMVQLWLTGREPNDGIVLRPLGEYTTLDRFGLYGTQASAALRPKLTITYTLLP